MKINSVRVSGLKFYRVYLEIFLGKGLPQEPEVDWQQPQPQGKLTGKVSSWTWGMGRGDQLSPEKSSKILPDAGWETQDQKTERNGGRQHRLRGGASGWGGTSERSIPCPRLPLLCSDRLPRVIEKQETEKITKREQKLWATSVPPKPCSCMRLAPSTLERDRVLWLVLRQSVISGLAGAGGIPADKWRSFACSGTWSWWLYEESPKLLYISYWSAWWSD